MTETPRLTVGRIELAPSPAVIAKNPSIFNPTAEDIRAADATPVSPLDEVIEPAWEGSEKELQQAAEVYLASKGYNRRTESRIQDNANGKWFLHIVRAKGNPIVMDLLVFDSTRGHYLELELKTARGKVHPRKQQPLIDRGEAVLCRSMGEVRAAVENWEAK